MAEPKLTHEHSGKVSTPSPVTGIAQLFVRREKLNEKCVNLWVAAFASLRNA